MKRLLIGAIKIYWKLVPAERRRKCLFKESCSIYVYKIAKAKGAIAGISALKRRFKQCRPGYKKIDLEDGSVFFLLIDGTIVESFQIKNEYL